MNRKPLLSLCMIVKDEAHCLSQCIESVRELVDEIVIVDTGSQDETCNIARAMGGRVVEYQWNQDFSVARNTAIKHAAGEWILVLDADEVLAPLSKETLHNMLATSSVDGFYVHIHNVIDDMGSAPEDLVVRLFRNRPSYRFTGSIHEQIAGSIQAANGGGGLGISDIVIRHFGYMSCEMQRKAKFLRNTEIIFHNLEKNPQDPFLLYSLAMEYLGVQDLTTAQETLYLALRYMRGDEGYFRHALRSLLISLLITGDERHWEDVVTMSCSSFPCDPELYGLKGLGALHYHHYGEAAEAFCAALSFIENTSSEAAEMLNALYTYLRLWGEEVDCRSSLWQLSPPALVKEQQVNTQGIVDIALTLLMTL